MVRRRHSDMRRDFDMEGRPPRGQYTVIRSTFTTSQSRHRGNPGQSVLPRDSMAGPSRPRRHIQDRADPVPNWIDELPRDYPQPPPMRPAPPPRTQFGQFQQATSVTPSNSVSRFDRQSSRSFREGRTGFSRDDMPRGSSGLARHRDSQFLNQRDTYGYDQRPNDLDRRNDPQWAGADPEMPRVVNNYITTNNHQQYNVDNSRHQRVNAQGQVNTTNIRHHSIRTTRGDTIDNSRTTQRLSSSGHQHHRRSRHHGEYRG
ncbi:hypothetical protein LA080_010369 [Diaporthe eres]|uniref:Uncharacterized protein n=1 Tax=Diaporthe vaccinii TaxID=105482 RepID=A0ABR4ECN1_9PEZI|nr:hypothetical protein LA080_010369 [Diaporthe eres]